MYDSEEDSRPLRTLDVFLKAGKRMPAAAAAWLAVLEQIDLADVRRIFERIPANRITRIACEFGCRMIELNRERLIRSYEQMR